MGSEWGSKDLYREVSGGSGSEVAGEEEHFAEEKRELGQP